jgi:hypothetical protein
MVAPPPSLHPHYQASSVLRRDPTSTAPSAFLASSARTGILPRGRKPWISLVTGMTHRQARTGLRPRVPQRLSPFARRRVLPSVMKSTSAHSLRYKISGLDTFTAWGPPRSIGPRLLSYLRINPSVTVQAARLDTGPVASRYPGGIFPRLPRRHCQVASCISLFACPPQGCRLGHYGSNSAATVPRAPADTLSWRLQEEKPFRRSSISCLPDRIRCSTTGVVPTNSPST